MALEDFYMKHPSSATRVQLHVRDSHGDDDDPTVAAAHAAEDLIKNVQVEAIIVAPQTLTEADFLAHLGNHKHIPILSLSGISPASSGEQPHKIMPYFVQAAANDLLQAKPIASIAMSFSWRQVILVCEDSPHGAAIFPKLAHELDGMETQISDVVFVPVDATEDRVHEVMRRLKRMETRVFIVHMRSSMAARFFAMANDLGMMSQGYAWIVTSTIGNAVDSLRSDHAINSMEGVLTLRPSVNETDHVKRFFARFQRKMISSYSDHSHLHDEPSMQLLWAYDTAWAIATAAETARLASFATGLAQDELPITGKTLLDSVLKTTFDGLAGKFSLDYNNGYQQQQLRYDILNVIGRGTRTVGTWMQDEHPISYYDRRADAKWLKIIIWPGDTTNVPKGWEVSPSGKSLVIAVPRKNGFRQFVNVAGNTTASSANITGYCIDLFHRVMQELKYEGGYEYVTDNRSEDYNHLVERVHRKEVDVLVGDITITAKRMENVTFTVPFTELGWTMMVMAKKDTRKSMWIFPKPFTGTLWLVTIALFLFIGFVVWVLEHRINPRFRGTPSEQLGTTFYFIFSTMVFSHTSLTSMSTVQQLRPAVTDVEELIRGGDPVGYHESSFVKDSLIKMGFKQSNLRHLGTVEQYNQALSDGSVKAIFDEIPYLKLFRSHFPNKYTMAGPVYKSGGFAFVFPQGSLLGRRVSEALMAMMESPSTPRNTLIPFPVNTTDDVGSPRLDTSDFSGLIIIVMTVSSLMLLTWFATFFYKEFSKRKVVEKEDVKVKYIWGCTLYHLDNLPFRLNDMPSNYSGFKEAMKSFNVSMFLLDVPKEVKCIPTKNALVW
ncbi:glutamate receptor 2.9-like [Oryza brachyantha]|uniref:glutamate receptor 2.9-like n=1 Tax=Oryza brachyantha TaxID=4533 RepID=UPI0003EAD7D0|nr:glutamate receptor 2.9-like [Oryza brachyantha]